MRWLKLSFIFGVAVFLAAALNAAEIRIIKVLPHYLDAKGRDSISPSLYERDAYQLYLRENPKLRKALRFDVQWKGKPPGGLKLKIEVRSGQKDDFAQASKETDVKKNGWFSNWSALTWEKNDYTKLGQMYAWRATLWDGAKQVAEQKSFLW